MHFEIPIEDKSGQVLLENIIHQLINTDVHTYKIRAFKGIGRIPKNMHSSKNAADRTLLANLPPIIRAYGKMYPCTSNKPQGVLIVICDLDDRCLKRFRTELYSLVESCEPHPTTKFCIAIEEAEAWLLGDKYAIKQAYPNAKSIELNSYKYDSICNTWEKLADTIYKGGSQKLKKEGWKAIGTEKTQWADKITRYMNIDQNKSPSFQYLKKHLQSQQ